MSQSSSMKFGSLQIGIILLTVATAVMHFILIFPDTLFILNALGYLGLLAALYLPLSFLSNYRSYARWGLMGYTALTILLWILIGQRGLYAYIDKLIEVVLIVLLWLESRPAAR